MVYQNLHIIINQMNIDKLSTWNPNVPAERPLGKRVLNNIVSGSVK